MTRTLLVVAVGGAMGALLRWGLSDLTAPASGFPWTTFAINVVGSALLALLPAFAAVRRHPLLPPFLGTGVLGGFTTLSACAEETRALAADGATGLAGGYLFGTLAAALLAVAAADLLTTRAQRTEFEAEEGDE